MTDSELIKKLDPEGNYNPEYVQDRINHIRERNEKEQRDINKGVEDIDLSMEYAYFRDDKKHIRKFSFEYLERKLRENDIKTTSKK